MVEDAGHVQPLCGHQHDGAAPGGGASDSSAFPGSLRGPAHTSTVASCDGTRYTLRCTVCSNAQVAQIDALLTSGSSVRAVARIHGLARSTVARHRGHISAARARLAVIQGQGDPLGPPDPLSEAFALAERARTPRERLRALEQIRAASKLRLRGITSLMTATASSWTRTSKLLRRLTEPLGISRRPLGHSRVGGRRSHSAWMPCLRPRVSPFSTSWASPTRQATCRRLE